MRIKIFNSKSTVLAYSQNNCLCRRVKSICFQNGADALLDVLIWSKIWRSFLTLGETSFELISYFLKIPEQLTLGVIAPRTSF